MSDDIEVVQPSAPAEPVGDNLGNRLDQIIDAAYEKAEAAAAPPDETAEEKSERLRDERGRFATKTPAEAEPSTDPAEQTANPAETPPVEPVEQPLEPHPRWSDADKAAFAKQPREVQQWMLERQHATEAEFTRKSQEFAEQKKSVEPLLNEVGRWSQYLQSLGATPEKAFSELIQTEYTLRTGSPEQKAQALSYLMNLYGVQLPSSGDGQADSYYATLANQVSQLNQKLFSIEQQSTQAERNRAEVEFNALALTKDDGGQLKYPHFDRVKQAMLQLVVNGQADTWEDAYDNAVWSNRELRAGAIEAERKRERDASEKARQEAVNKAKKAAPLARSNSQPRGNVEAKGVDAHIDAALAKHGYV